MQLQKSWKDRPLYVRLGRRKKPTELLAKIWDALNSGAYAQLNSEVRTMADEESFLTKWERVIKATPLRSWYCEPCAVEVYDRACPHCGKTKRQRS